MGEAKPPFGSPQFAVGNQRMISWSIHCENLLDKGVSGVRRSRQLAVRSWQSAVGNPQFAVHSWQSAISRGGKGEAQPRVGSPQLAVGNQHLIPRAIHGKKPFGQGGFRGEAQPNP